MQSVTYINSFSCPQQRKWLDFHHTYREHYKRYIPTHIFEYMARLMPPTLG